MDRFHIIWILGFGQVYILDLHYYQPEIVI